MEISYSNVNLRPFGAFEDLWIFPVDSDSWQRAKPLIGPLWMNGALMASRRQSSFSQFRFISIPKSSSSTSTTTSSTSGKLIPLAGYPFCSSQATSISFHSVDLRREKIWGDGEDTEEAARMSGDIWGRFHGNMESCVVFQKHSNGEEHVRKWRTSRNSSTDCLPRIPLVLCSIIKSTLSAEF